MKNNNGKTQKKREIEAPQFLGDLFAENDDEADEQTFSQLYEVQNLDIGTICTLSVLTITPLLTYI